MHQLLIYCVIAEGLGLCLLWWRSKVTNESFNQRFEQLIRQYGYDEKARLSATNEISQRVSESETKLSDLAEGCQRMDEDLSTVAADVTELSKLRGEESKELSGRIAEIAGEQEKIRKKAMRPASSGAWENIRSTAERHTPARNPEHDDMVALAEGPKSVQ